MSCPVSRLSPCVFFVALFAPGDPALGREGRELVHKMPPMSAQRVQDIIVQIPPLQPVSEPERLLPAPPRRKAMNAPTLEEAPGIAPAAPSLPEPAPNAASVGLRLSDPGGIVGVARPIEIDLPAPTVEWLRGRRAARSASMCVHEPAALPGGAFALAARTVLEDFLPCMTEPAVAAAQNAPPVVAPQIDPAAQDYTKYLAGAGVGLGVFAIFAFIGHRRLRARAAARLSAMSGVSSTADFRVVTRMPTLKGPLTRLLEFFDWLLVSMGGLRRGSGVPASVPENPSAAPGSTLVKVAALMRGSAREEPPAPPVDLSRILRTTRAPVIGTTALAETMIEPLHVGVETQLQTILSSADPIAAVAPAPVAASLQSEGRDAGAVDDLVLVEPGDAVAASAAINAARLRLEAER